MLFKRELVRKIFEGQKTQTRRIQKDGEYATGVTDRDEFGGVELVAPYKAIYGKRLKWMDGGVYGVQVKRGGHSIGKIRVLNLWDEDIRDIDTDNAIAEGFASKAEFFEAWQKINGKNSLSADVWVIEFEPIAKVGDWVVLQDSISTQGISVSYNTVGKLTWADNGLTELHFDPCIEGINPFFVHPDRYILST